MAPAAVFATLLDQDRYYGSNRTTVIAPKLQALHGAHAKHTGLETWRRLNI
jgi:hypothetical protein